MHDRFVVGALVLPYRDVGEVLVISHGFALFCLVLFAEVTAARFIACEGIATHEFGKFKEVRESSRVLEGLVHL